MSPIRKSSGITGLRQCIRKIPRTTKNIHVQGVARINLELSSGCHNTRVNRSPAEDSISCFKYLPMLSICGLVPRMQPLTNDSYQWSIVELPGREFKEREGERRITDPHLFPAPLSRRTGYLSPNSK